MINRSSLNFDVHSALNNTDEAVDIDIHLIVLSYFGYGTIFLMSLSGNSCLIHIIRTDASMKTALNYLILHQACADLLKSFMHLMETVRVNSYHGSWFGGNMGNITCKLYLASFYVLSAFSIFLLVAIAVDRFYAVFRPLDDTPISQNIKKVILTLWTCSLIMSPTAVVINGHVVSKENSYFCRSRKLLNFNEGTELNVISLTLGVVIPLALLAVLYTRICIKLWSRQAPGEGANINLRHLQVIATARKVTRMIIAVFVLFLICWAPFYITMALLYFGFVQYKVVLFPIWLTVSFSGINPCVYFAFSTNFRNGLKRLFGNIRVFPSRSVSIELQQI